MNAEDLKILIAETFPDIEIRKFSSLGMGRSTYVYLVNDEIVMRVPKNDPGHQWPDSPEKEVGVLNFLRGKLDIKIPEIVCHAQAKDGRHIVGETLVLGTLFTQAMFDSFADETKWDILRQIGRIMRELHDVPGRVPGVGCGTYQDTIRVFNEYFSPEIRALFSDAEIAEIQNISDNYEKLSIQHPAAPVLTHCDLHFGNMMFDVEQKRVCGLIDFGSSGYAEPARDMHYYFGDGAKEILSGYGDNGDKYLPERQKFQSITNMLSNIGEDIRENKPTGENKDLLIKTLRE